MSKRLKDRNCEDCFAYWNMLDGDTCGLGYPVVEYSETVLNIWHSGVCPENHACDGIPMPKSKDDFMRLAQQLGLDWNEDELVEVP